MSKSRRILIYTISGMCLTCCISPLRAQQRDSVSQLLPRVITIDAGKKEYMRILGGPPETSTMRSGLVQLAPGESVGTHNTEKYEEMLIVMSGSAEMIITNGKKLQIAKGDVAYCPPRTEHNVLNTGTDTLRYIYVVAEAKEQKSVR